MSGEKKLLIYLVIAAIVMVFVISMLPWVTIGAGQKGVVMRFGKVQPVILDEGFHFIQPFADDVKKIDVRVQKTDIPNLQAASGDLQTVTLKITVNWHMDSNKVNKIYQSIGDEKAAIDNIITPNTNEVVKAATAQKTAENLLKQRPNLKKDIDTNLAKRLKEYNIILDDVSVVDLDFDPEFNKAIEAKARAEQESLKAKKDLERIGYESQQKERIAQAEAQSIQIKGAALRDNPQLVQLNAVEKWNGVLPVNMYGSAPLPFLNISQ